MKKQLACALVLLPLALGAQSIPGAKKPLSAPSVVIEYDKADDFDRLIASKSLVLLSSASSLPKAKPNALAASLFSRPGGRPNGALVGTDAGTVYWFSKADSSFTPLFSLDRGIRSIAMSGDQNLISAVSEGGRAYLWRRDEPERLTELRAEGLKEDRGETSARFGGVSLDEDGSTMCISLEEGNSEETWYVYYLAGSSGNATRRLRSGAAIAPDGQHLIRRDFDYEHKDAADHPFAKIQVLDFAENEIATFSLPTDPKDWDSNSRYVPTKRFDEVALPISAWFMMSWSEFGLLTLTERKDYAESWLHFNIRELAKGSRGLPEAIAAYRPDGFLSSASRARGFGVQYDEGDYSVALLSRVSEVDGSTIWSRKIRLADRSSIWHSAFVDPEQGYLAYILGKQRPNNDFTETRIESFLRLVDWNTGRTIGEDIPLLGSGASEVLSIGPSLDYILLGCQGQERFALYWPKTLILRSLDGARTYSGPGVRRFAPGLQGSVAFESGGRPNYVPAAPGQIGSVLQLAVDPDQRLLAAIDESGQLFIHEISSGRTLYSAQLAVRPGYVVAPATKVEDLANLASGILGSSDSGSTTRPYELRVVNIAKSSDFKEPANEK